MYGRNLRFDNLEQQIEDVIDKLEDVTDPYMADPTNADICYPLNTSLKSLDKFA